MPVARRRILTRCARWFPRFRVHALLEISHPPLRQSLLRGRHRSRVLLEGVQQDDQVPGSLIENPGPRVGEPDSQLAQLSLDLRTDWKLRRRRIGCSTVEVLLDVIVNLRRPLRGKRLDELVNRFAPTLVAIVDRLRLRHSSSMADNSAHIRLSAAV
jgi:hypothetical protein